MNRDTIFIVLVLFSIVTTFWYLKTTNTPLLSQPFFEVTNEVVVMPLSYEVMGEIAEIPLFLAIADTYPERVQGLSGQKSLPSEHGLLFLFESEGLHSIWMKDMLFPIDVLWFDQNKRVIFVYENFSPESFPTSVGSPTPSIMVLELPAGFVQKHGIKIGDSISF